MTLNKRPGIYFSETVTVNTTTYDGDYVPLFLIQGGESIAAIDDKLVLYEEYEAFRNVLDDNLPISAAIIEQAIIEGGIGRFYVQKLSAATATAFTKALADCGSKSEIRDVIYIEEGKAADVSAIITAIKTGLNDNFTNGTPRTAVIIPYGTITDAISKQGANTTDAETIITQFTALTNGTGSGRILLTVPDRKYAGAIAGRIATREYNDEIAKYPLNYAIDALTYTFTDSQIVTLTQKGVLLVTERQRQGNTNYYIEMGVTGSYKDDGADAYLITRSIADELLRRCKYAIEDNLFDKETEMALAKTQSDVDGVIKDFAVNEDVDGDDTYLNVVEDDEPYVAHLAGQIVAAGSMTIIEINSTLSVSN